ncbi:class I SAM-dependent methyltransferase [Leptolyngbya sp. CCY15150]|uniref:class I SAM-dependent methyltransferase n=1 Tax=Leptolyngbya sp. CCY15150 TaxID=2767772 RepID=UPI001EF2DB95|nr:class I SAM-dependent methyltransferase [Leptolyngbya sp. CCY15150]
MAKATEADEQTIHLQDSSNYATMADLKRSLLGRLQGRVLEIGPGAGTNLAYFSPDIHWIGVEPNLFTHPYLRQGAERHGLKDIELYGQQAEQLPVEDGTLDAVVSTYVLCSVTDIDTTLKDIQRVLKPGGKFVFMEHVAATDGTCTRTVQDGITPIWKTVFDHCHPNRETWINLEKAGFATVDYQTFRLSIPVVSPHIAGVATRSSVDPKTELMQSQRTSRQPISGDIHGI